MPRRAAARQRRCCCRCATLIGSMDAIETCSADRAGLRRRRSTALVLRHLEPLSAATWPSCAPSPTQHPACSGGCSPRAGHGAACWTRAAPNLAYTLPEFGITHAVQAHRFHAGQPAHQPGAGGPRAAAAGPAARRAGDRLVLRPRQFHAAAGHAAGEVLGIEGSETLVARRARTTRATRTAVPAGARTRFAARNLFEMTAEQLVADGRADNWLVDPPREGAFALAKALADLHQQPRLRGGWRRPGASSTSAAIPATLARDAGPAGAPGRLPLHGGRRGEHVPAHGARGVDRRVRRGLGPALCHPVAR